MCVITRPTYIDHIGVFNFGNPTSSRLCSRSDGHIPCSRARYCGPVVYLDQSGNSATHTVPSFTRSTKHGTRGLPAGRTDPSLVVARLEEYAGRERDRDSHTTKRTNSSKKQMVRGAEFKFEWPKLFGSSSRKEKHRSKSRRRKGSHQSDFVHFNPYISGIVPPAAPSPPFAVEPFSATDSDFSSHSIFSPPSQASTATSLSFDEAPPTLHFGSNGPFYISPKDSCHYHDGTGGLNITVDPTTQRISHATPSYTGPPRAPPPTPELTSRQPYWASQIPNQFMTNPQHQVPAYVMPTVIQCSTGFPQGASWNDQQHALAQAQHQALEAALRQKDARLQVLADELQEAEAALKRSERAKQLQLQQDISLRRKLDDELITKLAEEKAERDFLRSRTGAAAKIEELERTMRTLRSRREQVEEHLADAKAKDRELELLERGDSSTRRRTVHWEDERPRRRHDRDSGVGFDLGDLKDIIAAIDTTHGSNRAMSDDSDNDVRYKHGHQQRPHSWHYTHPVKTRPEWPQVDEHWDGGRRQSWSARPREDDRYDRGYQGRHGDRDVEYLSRFFRSPHW